MGVTKSGRPLTRKREDRLERKKNGKSGDQWETDNSPDPTC